MAHDPVSIDIWARLGAGGYCENLAGIPNYAASVHSPYGPVRLALGEDGQFKLLLPIGSYDRLPSFPATPALVIESKDYRNGAALVRYLEVTNHSEELNSVFAEFSDAILQRIGTGSRCQDALIEVLAEFKALLLPEQVREATLERVVGLVGELLVLKRFFQLGACRLEVWSGCDGLRHDFSASTMALEVKSSTRVGKNSVRISSAEQLIPPVNGDLQLVHLILEPVDAGEVTLEQVFEDISTMCPDVMQLRRLIAAAGCPSPSDPSWNRFAFRPPEWSFYQVTAGFPAIVPSSFTGGILPAGVGGISYNIDLDYAIDYLIDDYEGEQYMRRLGGVV